MRYFQCDLALKLLVGGEIDNTESTATENALNDKPPNFSRELLCGGKLQYGPAMLLCEILSGIVGHDLIARFVFKFLVTIVINCSKTDERECDSFMTLLAERHRTAELVSGDG